MFTLVQLCRNGHPAARFEAHWAGGTEKHFFHSFHKTSKDHGSELLFPNYNPTKFAFELPLIMANAKIGLSLGASPHNTHWFKIRVFPKSISHSLVLAGFFQKSSQHREGAKSTSRTSTTWGRMGVNPETPHFTLKTILVA